MNEYYDRFLNPAASGTGWTRGHVRHTGERSMGHAHHPNRGRFHRERDLGLEERRKEQADIARELHDTLFQGFLGASLLLHTTVEQLPADSPSRTPLSHALRVMYRVIDEGRAALGGLRSPTLASTNLEQALCALGEEFTLGEAGYRVFVSGKPKALKPSIQEQIYLVGREALINALRHSKGTSIEVHVEYLSNKVRLIVRDNGTGIDTNVLRSGRNSHWGLLGMRERAEGIGAQLSVRSRRGAGTEVELTVQTIRAEATEPL
jgi:signal transduction histidine kinase